VRFEVFIVIKIQVVFWILIPCSDVVGYQHFGGPCCMLPLCSSEVMVSYHITIWYQNPEDHSLF